MKQIIFATCVFLAVTAYGQIAKSKSDSAEPEGKNKTNKLYSNEINSRAKRDFANRYKNVANEKWTVTSEGTNVSFTMGEIRCSVRYDKNGYRMFTLRSYPEKYLPKNIRTQVRSTYFDYNIKWVQEIAKNLNPIVYVVLLESDKEWIKVRVGDGELTELEKLDK